MRGAIATISVVAALGCATMPERPVPSGESHLSPQEAAAAQSAALHGDATISVLGVNGAEYTGTAIVRVHTGDIARVDLALVGRNPLDMSENFGGALVIPPDYAYTLASTGWNFTTSRPDPDPDPVALLGQRLAARLNTMTMHADPNGLFFATLEMTDAETSEPRTVTVAGRLTGGCEVNEGGSVMMIADPSTDPECESVIGSL